MTVLENVIEAPIIVNKMKKPAAIEAALPYWTMWVSR
jgi:ABC-type histidine transport system ATPase subunit